jgi:hypothetical protein
MDISANVVLLISVFAFVVIVGLMISRRVRAKIKGPGGTGLEIDASNEPASPSPAVRVSEAKSRSGGLAARDETGRGVEVSKVEVERDITATKRERMV